jgi:site-specific recombinase XerD
MTVENFNAHLGIKGKAYPKKREDPKEDDALQESFLDYMRDNIAKTKMRESTRKQKMVTLNALIEFGKIQTFADLTPRNLLSFNSWLHEDGTRSDVSVHNYHKNFHIQTRKAFQDGLISEDPYEKVNFPRGKCKERKPLSEMDLKKIREAELPSKEARVRDLFIFAAYTGLAYCDVQEFDFAKMTEKVGDLYYIDGSRLKTGSNFFTPILPPAMEILKMYEYTLPKISNQKANDYLHLIESRLGINKSITFHVARHSFATIALSHDVPIDKVARMMGHKDIKTTQIYAKILKETVVRHADNLSKLII